MNRTWYQGHVRQKSPEPIRDNGSHIRKNANFSMVKSAVYTPDLNEIRQQYTYILNLNKIWHLNFRPIKNHIGFVVNLQWLNLQIYLYTKLEQNQTFKFWLTRDHGSHIVYAAEWWHVILYGDHFCQVLSIIIKSMKWFWRVLIRHYVHFLTFDHQLCPQPLSWAIDQMFVHNTSLWSPLVPSN